MKYDKDIENTIENTKDQVNKSAGQAKDAIINIANGTKDKLQNLESNIENYAKEKPWQLIAWSVLAGAVISKFISK